VLQPKKEDVSPSSLQYRTYIGGHFGHAWLRQSFNLFLLGSQPCVSGLSNRPIYYGVVEQSGP